MASRSVHLMLVAAHPSDSFDQAGGTLAHHAARGEMVGGIMPLPPDMAFTSRFRVPKDKYRE